MEHGTGLPMSRARPTFAKPARAAAQRLRGRTRGWWFACMLACATFGNLTAARASDFDNRPGVWLATFYGSTIDVGGPEKTGPHLWFDLHLRQRPPTSDDGVGSFLAIIRPAVGYQFLPWLTADLGYAFLPRVTSDGDDSGAEHRLWTQLILGSKFGPATVQFRPRFELRFDDVNDTIGTRIRGFVRVNVDLTGPLYLPIWDESFWQLNRFGRVEAGLEEHRVFLGAGLRPAPYFAVELGYMNRWLPAGTTGNTGQMEHTALVSLIITPTLRIGG